MINKGNDMRWDEVVREIVTHFIHRSFYAAVLYIVQDSVVEKHCVLWNDADALD